MVCVASNARSGSTALREALAASGVFFDFGEIFHDDFRLAPFPFLGFLDRWPDPVAALLKKKDATAIARAYLEQLAFQSNGLRPLIDVKHNCWSVLRPLWQYPHDQPLFMWALKARGTTFVLLRRANLGDQILSYYIATHTNIWHAPVRAQDVPADIQSRRLEPDVARRLAILFARSEAQTESFLRGYPNVVQLTYETAFERGVLSAGAAAELSKVLGVPIPRRPIAMKPNPLDKRAVVSNYDEVCEIAAAVRRSVSGVAP
jgi:LPS sulfotransferase NodH